MTLSVVLVDYGIGNIHSVEKALVRAGAEVQRTGDANEIRRASRLVLPGVGAFADCARALATRGLSEPVREYALSGRPFLGICVGMQLLFSESEEFGRCPGLGVIPGRVVAIRPRAGLKIPQIGWNRVRPAGGSDWKGTPLARLAPGAMMYFVHSFSAEPDEEESRLADATYGDQRVTAAVRRNATYGLQFHPEKSGEAGLSVLGEFLAA